MRRLSSILLLFCLLCIQSIPVSAQDKAKKNDDNKTKKEQVKEKDTDKCDDSSCKKNDEKKIKK